MAFKSASIVWEFGGLTHIQVPDRLRICCPICGESLGKNVQLFFYEGLAGQLDIGVVCSKDGEVRENPFMEVIQ